MTGPRDLRGDLPKWEYRPLSTVVIVRLCFRRQRSLAEEGIIKLCLGVAYAKFVWAVVEVTLLTVGLAHFCIPYTGMECCAGAEWSACTWSWG